MFRVFQKSVFYKLFAAKCPPQRERAALLPWTVIVMTNCLPGDRGYRDWKQVEMQATPNSHLDSWRTIKSNTYKMALFAPQTGIPATHAPTLRLTGHEKWNIHPNNCSLELREPGVCGGDVCFQTALLKVGSDLLGKIKVCSGVFHLT